MRLNVKIKSIVLINFKTNSEGYLRRQVSSPASRLTRASEVSFTVGFKGVRISIRMDAGSRQARRGREAVAACEGMTMPVLLYKTPFRLTSESEVSILMPFVFI